MVSQSKQSLTQNDTGLRRKENIIKFNVTNFYIEPDPSFKMCLEFGENIKEASSMSCSTKNASNDEKRIKCVILSDKHMGHSMETKYCVAKWMSLEQKFKVDLRDTNNLLKSVVDDSNPTHFDQSVHGKLECKMKDMHFSKTYTYTLPFVYEMNNTAYTDLSVRMAESIEKPPYWKILPITSSILLIGVLCIIVWKYRSGRKMSDGLQEWR